MEAWETIALESPYFFNSKLQLKEDETQSWYDLSLGHCYGGIDWARGLEMLEKKGANLKVLSLDKALHGLEVLQAIKDSYEQDTTVSLSE